MEFQTRSETNGLQSFHTFKGAMNAAKADETIWKISFTLETGERIRLVKEGGYYPDRRWIYESLLD